MLAGAIPFVFLHETYNPGFELAVGSTSIGVELSDVAVLAVVSTAIAAERTRLAAIWRAARGTWAAAAALVLAVAAATAYGPLVSETYALAASVVSMGTFVEYALLAPAVAVSVRSRIDAAVLAVAAVAWGSAASAWGVLQFLGIVDEFEGRRPLQREPSFVGIHDFAALEGAVLGIGLTLLVLGRPTGRTRWLAAGALVAGGIGVVLAGAVAVVAAVVVAGVGAIVVGRLRGALTLARALVVGAVVLTVAAGAAALRSGDLGDFFAFAVSREADPEGGVETYSQRTALSYIGLRMARDHPLLGVGWQGSLLEENYGPYLEDARERFPSLPAEAFPSPEHPWGIQNAYVQAGADLGVGGAVALALTVVLGLAGAARTALRGRPVCASLALAAALALLVAAAALAALGLVPGVPATALLWIALGLSVASRRALADDRDGNGPTDGSEP